MDGNNIKLKFITAVWYDTIISIRSHGIVYGTKWEIMYGKLVRFSLQSTSKPVNQIMFDNFHYIKRINHEPGLQIEHHATFEWVSGINPYEFLYYSYELILYIYTGRDWMMVIYQLLLCRVHIPVVGFL